jgi:hypothetical protein
MLHSRLTNCSGATDISILLNDIDCKLVKLGNALYGNAVYMMNNDISAVDIIDLLTYKRILTFKQVNPNYASVGSSWGAEMIGDVIQWNQTNLIYRTPYIFWWNRIIKDAISTDTIFPDLIPQKTVITTISVDNLTTNGFQLVIQLSDTTELLNEYINPSGFLTLTLNTPVNSLSGINITSPSWNGAEINLSLTIENPF